MADRYFTIIRKSDGYVMTVGKANNDAQVEAQKHGLPSDQDVLIDVEGPLGWYWNGTDFDPPPDPVITVEMVKREQARRLTYTDGLVARSMDPTDGRPIPPDVIAQRQAIRDGAHRLEAMDPIPTDYRDCKYWTQSVD